MEMKDLCGDCRHLVRQRDPALEYDACSRWFHLRCNTGKTKRAYDAAIAKGKEIEQLPWSTNHVIEKFFCGFCRNQQDV